MSAGRNEKVAPGNFCGSIVRSCLMKFRGRRVILFQADQGVAVLRPDGAGVLIGHVDAGERQADIVDDVVELIGRNGLADGLLDQVEQPRRLLDAGAGLGAHVHQDLPGIDRREEVLAEKRPEAEGEHDAGQKTDDEQLRAVEREQQQRAVAVADTREAALEPLSENA